MQKSNQGTLSLVGDQPHVETVKSALQRLAVKATVGLSARRQSRERTGGISIPMSTLGLVLGMSIHAIRGISITSGGCDVQGVSNKLYALGP